jgi:ketosteroid isomerase-like protein
MFLALAAALLAAAPALAAPAPSPEAEVLALVRQFLDSYNAGDTKTAIAACGEQTDIIDEFPPYEWHGTGACATWFGDYDVDAGKNGITDGHATLGKPRHVDVSGDRAYVVAPADYNYKKHGKPVRESGSTLTVALQKGATGWHIIGWTWAKR